MSESHPRLNESVVLLKMPCFPRKQPRVIQPEETVQHKNVHRYGETNVRYVNQPLKLEQWRRGKPQNPNTGRPLPNLPQDQANEPQPKQLPPVKRTRPVNTEYSMTSTPRPAESEYSIASTVRSQQRAQPVTADFFVSVPIFNETHNHSYRKKNEYVYFDRADDEGSLYHQSLSRNSSLRDVRQLSARRPPSGHQYSDRRRHHSSHRGVVREHRRRPVSGSEASYNTFSSRGTYGYESETFEEAKVLRKARSTSGLNVDSDDEDCR